MSKFLKFGIAMMLAVMMGTTLFTSGAFAQTATSRNAGTQTIATTAPNWHYTQGNHVGPRKYNLRNRYVRHVRCVWKNSWYRWNGRWYKKSYRVCGR